MRQEELRTEKHASEVGRDFTIPFFHRCVFNRLVHLDRSVVKQDIDPSKGEQGLFYKGFDRFGSRDVSLNGDGRASGGLNLLGRLTRSLQVEVSEHNLCTFFGELEGARAADAGA